MANDVLAIIDELNYLALGEEIMHHGALSDNRTGVDTKKLFGRQLRFNLSGGRIPLLTSKYVNYDAVVSELDWFIRGCTNNNYLNKLGTGIWNQWAACDGSLGPIYGAMWRRRPISLGAVGQTVTVEELQARYKRTDDIIEVEQNAIEGVINLNLGWITLKDKYPKEFGVWSNMLKFCGSRYILAMSEGKISVTTKMEASSKQRKAWADKIMNETIWKHIGTDMFAAAQPAEIYKPWLSFENFLLDIGRIAYNECRDRSTCRITTYFHGVKFYSPWTTTFYTPVLQLIAKDWMTKSSKLEMDTLRPKIFTDQLGDLVKTLKENPSSRRMVVNSWEPSFIPDESATPKENPALGLQAITPCHHDWQVCVRDVSVEDLSVWVDESDLDLIRLHNNDAFIEASGYDNDTPPSYARISYLLSKANANRAKEGLEPMKPQTVDLRFSMRSTDVFLGLPFNIASYAVLTHVLAKIAGMNAGELVYQGTDVHLYENTFEQMQTQLKRKVNPFPILKVAPMDNIDDFSTDKLTLCNYAHEGVIKAQVAV